MPGDAAWHFAYPVQRVASAVGDAAIMVRLAREHLSTEPALAIHDESMTGI